MNLRLAFLLTTTALSMPGCRDNASPPTSVAESTPTTITTTGKTNLDDASDSSLHQFGDFSFAIPDGWTVVAPDRDKTKAMILLDGTNWQNAKAMIKVDVGTPAATTATELARGFAEGTGGTVAAEPMDFDGTPGINASTPSTTLATPRHMVVVYRDDKAYLLMAGAVKGVALGEAIAQIRDTWTWAK